MPLKRPDGRWIIIKINVINELPLFVSAAGSAPELWACSRRRRGIFFLQYWMPHNPNVPARIMNREEWVLYGKGMGRHYCE